MRKFILTLYPRNPDYRTVEFTGIRLGDVHKTAEQALQNAVATPDKCLAMVDEVIASWETAKPNCEAIGLSGSNPDFACEIRSCSAEERSSSGGGAPPPPNSTQPGDKRCSRRI
jgi:hypothetical protein